MFTRISFIGVVLFLFFCLTTPGRATIWSDSTDFPPPAGMLYGDSPVLYGPGNEFAMFHLILQNPSNHRPLLPPESFSINSFFDVFTELSFVGYPEPPNYLMPMTCNSPVVIQVNYVSTSEGTSTFQAEMLSMNLTGTAYGQGVIIRESPLLHSNGEITIEDLGGGGGGGRYKIDSFFDVFTELSLDGGMTWMPGDMPMHLSGEPLPEPSTIVLICLAGLSFIAWSKKCRK
jgi:hypothetical protein